MIAASSCSLSRCRKQKNGNYRPGIEGYMERRAGLPISGKEERF
jgi:hypothetical protein